ncbi:MAG: hypothetical protein FWE95_01265 [Planctomycetaceae bacterium]|nr:hypothetical protein [Planctomycetaceae bacterium]
MKMDTDQKKYPTRFYGRTFLPWAGLLFLGPCSVAWCIMGPLFFLGIGIAPDEADMAVRRFLFNPDTRELLPSWQDEGTTFGNDTFDFR